MSTMTRILAEKPFSLDTQATQYGFAVQHLAVKPPGSTRRRPGCGSRLPSPTGSSCAPMAMTWTALKEAAQVGFPATRWWGITGPARSQT